ncbi:MAG TPA: FHA domain-containing protein [Kofleriaceae bacterium]|jgi:pSer/pThr/pTyr-binding forkhead associated (FHA) protein
MELLMVTQEGRGGPTKTDASPTEWTIDDPVTRLRIWATDRIFKLPAAGEVVAGADESCAVPLLDPSRRISHQHLRLTFDGARWVGVDLQSKNGVRVDGVRRERFAVDPGLELRLGGITLIPESERLIALRGFVARILGFATSKLEAIDLSVKAIRMAAMRRAPLVLCGSGDLIPIALALHRHTHQARPFVVCDPKREDTSSNTRTDSLNIRNGMAALAAAASGTLCVRAKRLPNDYADVTHALRGPAAQAQLVICSEQPEAAHVGAAAPVVIPILDSRAKELPLVVEGYAADAAASLGLDTSFPATDRDWILRNSAESLLEIENGTRRLVALRAAPTVSAAAALLGIAQQSLSEWIGRRVLPPGLLSVPASHASPKPNR